MEYSDSPKQLNIPLIIFIGLQVVFLILLAISIPNLFQNNKIDGGDFRESSMASINNLSEILPDLSSTEIEAIEQSLFGVILNNTYGENASRLEAEARIVPETVSTKYFAVQNLNYFSSVIDVPALEQSYQIFFTYSNDPNNQYIDPAEPFVILCPQEDFAVLYQDFDCKEVFTYTSRNKIVANVIRYFNFDNFSTFIDENEPSKIVISPIASNINADDRTSFIARAKQAVSSLGVSPELFEYYITTATDLNYHLKE